MYFDLDKYDSKLDILNALSIPYYYGGTTNTADAITEMLKMFADSSGVWTQLFRTRFTNQESIIETVLIVI